MAIKRNPKTGKYYIAPSPPSFYKSKPAPSKKTGSGGSSSGKTESQLIAEMRAGGQAYLKKHPGAFGGGISPVTGVRTAPTTTEKKLVASLTARAEITQKAKDQGKGLTRLQIQRELRKRGTSISELRKATSIARAHFRKTGVSITGQIRKDIRDRRLAEQQRAKEEFEKKLEWSKREAIAGRKYISPIKLGDVISPKRRIFGPIQKITRLKQVGEISILTEKNLYIKQEQLNKDIENFNKKYGSKELSEMQYEEANKVYKSLENREQRITQKTKEIKDKFDKSLLGKIKKFRLSPYTKKAFLKAEERGWSKDKIAETISSSPALMIDKKFSFLNVSTRNFLKKFQGIQKNVIIGALEGIEAKPEQTVAIGVASYLSSPIITGLGGVVKASKYIKPLLKVIPSSVKKKGAKAVAHFLSTAYFTTTGITIAKTEKGQRAKKIGEILMTEVLPYKIGSKLYKNMTSTKTMHASKKSFIIDKPVKPKKPRTRKMKPFPQEFNLKINDKAVKSYVKTQLKKRNINFDKLNKVDKDFITGQVKAKIRNNPELFIPTARRIALKKAKMKNIKRLLRKRLKGDFDTVISFEKATKHIPVQKLTKTQKLALKRFQRALEKKRIKKAIKFQLKEKKFKDILTTKQKDLLISKLKAKIKADPQLFLTKTQKLALRKVKRMSELSRIKKAVTKGRKPLKRKDILSSQQKKDIKLKLKRELKFNLKKFIPKERQLALKRFARLQEKKAVRRAIKKGPEKLKPYDLVSKQDKEIIISRIKSLARNQPEKFIPSARRQVLIQVQKQKTKLKTKQIPTYEIVSGKLTSIQKLTLKRLNKINRQRQGLNTDTLKLKTKQNQTKQSIIQTDKQIQKLKSKRKLKSKQKQTLMQKTKKRKKLKTKQKQISKTGALLLFKQRQLIHQAVKIKQKLKQKLRTRQIPRLRTRQKLKVRQIPKLTTIQKIAQRVKPKVKPKFKPKLRPKKVKAPIIKRRKIIRKPSKIKRKVRNYNVYAKPIKTLRGKKAKKLIKINKYPLSKSKAEDLRNFITDTSLSRTARIQSTKGKVGKPRLKVPRGYAKRTSVKFRKYKIVKGKRKLLRRGKVIEKRGRLLDTRSEKKGITLRRRIKQITIKPRRKPIRNIVRSPHGRILRRKKGESLKSLSRRQTTEFTKPKNKRRKPIRRKTIKRRKR